MVQKLVKDEIQQYDGFFIHKIIELQYRCNMDWVIIKKYHRESPSKDVDCTITNLSRKEYTALYDFIDNFCPFWVSSLEDDQYGEKVEVI